MRSPPSRDGFPEQIFKWPTADDQKTMPTNREMADHSPLYLMAATLTDGECGPKQFAAARLADPAIHQLMTKAKMVPDAKMTTYYKKATGAAVTVTMKNGQAFESVCAIPPGHPENRLTGEQLKTQVHELRRTGDRWRCCGAHRRRRRATRDGRERAYVHGPPRG